jgi:hypothetical protein
MAHFHRILKIRTSRRWRHTSLDEGSIISDLFTCGTFNEVVSSSECIVLDDMMVNE